MQKLYEMELDIFEYLEKSDTQFFFLINPEKGECRWSSNAKNFFAIEEQHLSAFDWKWLIHPADLDPFCAACLDIQRRHTKQFSGEYRFLLRDGSYAWVQCNCSMVFSASEKTILLSGLVNRLYISNNFDPVTNLRYIGSFRSDLADITTQSSSWGILLIGIDDFKRVNNLHSYSFGDEILAAFSAKISKILPEGVKIFRLDGDNFGLLYQGAEVTALIELFDKLQFLAQQPIQLQNITVSLTISGSIARYPEDGKDADVLYKNARIAFVESKRRGKKQVTVCSPSLCALEQRRMSLLEIMRQNVYHGCTGFSLYYQPLIHSDSEKLYGCEVLLRFKHPDFLDGVSPYEFIPILEDSGLIFEVNKWLLKTALAQCRQWLKIFPSFHMNINISYIQFKEPKFKFLIMNMLTLENVPPSAITLELTENHEVSDMEMINQVFSFLRGQGIKIALDDFGVGYSSLSIFQLLKVDQLKIDRRFLRRLTYDVTDQALVQQLIKLCHNMNMMVCVEGVENNQITEIVKEFGPELLQGFYYGQPMAKTEFEQQYFLNIQNQIQKEEILPVQTAPEFSQSMVYSTLRPSQPMNMSMIVNNAHAGIFQVALDMNFSFITCNEGYRKMLGYTAKDIDVKFGNHALGIVFPDDMEYVNQEIRRQLGEGDTVTIEFRVVRSDGTPIWILGTGNVVKASDGSMSLVVVIIDNNRLKNQQLELEKKCKRFEKILSNIPVGVKCVQNNEDFDLDYMSPAFLSLLGYEEKDLETLFDHKYINMVVEEDRPVVLSDVMEQVKSSNIVTLRYRSPCKGGQPIWVETISKLCPPEEDGIQRWYSSVVNITDTITEEQKSHAKNFANRIQLASKQWGDVLFEYDFMSGRVTFTDNYTSLFCREPQKEMMAEFAFIYPDDRNLFLNLIHSIHEGLKPASIEVRYYSEDRGYFWVSVIFTKPNTLGEIPVSAIGRITDIDEEKKQKEELVMQSKIDGMTGVLNKKSIEESIRNSISVNSCNGKSYALCVLDIDDFKGINDTLGHMFGDQVLKITANRLQMLDENSVTVGRAGGDEFFVFSELDNQFKTADELGKKIVETISQPIEYEGKQIVVTSSVGISLFPRDGTDFYKLFRLADSALYLVKAQGKSGYHISMPTFS